MGWKSEETPWRMEWKEHWVWSLVWLCSLCSETLGKSLSLSRVSFCSWRCGVRRS